MTNKRSNKNIFLITISKLFIVERRSGRRGNERISNWKTRVSRHPPVICQSFQEALWEASDTIFFVSTEPFTRTSLHNQEGKREGNKYAATCPRKNRTSVHGPMQLMDPRNVVENRGKVFWNILRVINKTWKAKNIKCRHLFESCPYQKQQSINEKPMFRLPVYSTVST